MTEDSPPLHYPGEVTKRPKGILKNASYTGSGQVPTLHRQSSPNKPDFTADTETLSTAATETVESPPVDSKELTLQNTLQNAGHRRSSSTARRASATRRHSSTGGSSGDVDDHEARLKWDEANLYLAEQNRTATMKITEPKTPYAQKYNPDEDPEEEEDITIDPTDLAVDELDKASVGKKKKKTRESDIPGLELGDPEEAVDYKAGFDDDDRIFRLVSVRGEGSVSSREKHVSVGQADQEEQVGMPTREEMEKHRRFEERRKRHYKMREVKNLLGHPEDLDEMEEDDEGDKVPPPMPSLPSRGVNGGKA